MSITEWAIIYRSINEVLFVEIIVIFYTKGGIMARNFDIRYSLFKVYDKLPNSIKIELIKFKDLGMPEVKEIAYSYGGWVIHIDGNRYPQGENSSYDLGSLDKAFMMAYLEYIGGDHETILERAKQWEEEKRKGL
jgi:hypothetical protein